MLFERVVLENFLVFSGKQEIVFRFSQETGRSMVVVLAPNNAGKTSLIRAFEFFLYGDVGGVSLDKIPNLAAVARSKRGKEPRVSVTVRFLQGKRKYTVTRWLSFIRPDEATMNIRVVGQGLEGIRHGDLTDEKMTDPDAIQQLLEDIIPRELFDFFFFKGEELSQRLIEGKVGGRVPERLRKLLYQEVFAEARKTLAEVGKKLQREAAPPGEIRNGIEENLARQGALEESVERQKLELERVRKEIGNLTKRKEEIDEGISELVAQVNPKRREELEKTRVRVKTLEEKVARAEREFRDGLGRSSAAVLAVACSARVREVLKEVRKGHGLPPEISEGLLRRMLERGRCICGRPLVKGEPAFETIKELRDKSLAQPLANELFGLDSHLSANSELGFWGKARKFCEEQTRLERLLVELQKEIQENQNKIRWLEQLVSEEKEERVRGLRRARALVEGELRSKNAEVQKLGSTIDRNETTLKELRRELDRLRAKLPDAERVKALVEIVKELQRRADEACKEIEAFTYERLKRDVAQFYERIVTDGSFARVDRRTLLPGIQRAGLDRLPSGGGQSQVLLLCFITALGALRTAVNSRLREVFRIPSFPDQAFVMDSVFGQMEPAYRRAVVSLLAKHLPQCVLLLAKQQWDEYVAEGVGEHLSALFGLLLHTPKRNVDLSEYEYDVFGEKVRLLHLIPAEGQAFSRIEELRRV